MARRPKAGSVRNVVSGRSDGYTGRVPFARLGFVSVGFESMLARDFLVTTSALEHDIVEINSEPFWLEGRVGHSDHRWLPDYRIVRSCGPMELIEVKPVYDVHPDLNPHYRDLPADVLGGKVRIADERFAAMEQLAKDAGYVFRLLTEEEIRVEPRLGNCALMLRYAEHFFPPQLVLAGKIALATNDIWSVGDLQDALPDGFDALPIALRLAWLGDLEFDPTVRITRRSAFARVKSQRMLSLQQQPALEINA